MIRTAAVAYAVLLAMLCAGAPAALAHLPYAVESPVASSSAAETAPAAMGGMVAWESDAAGDWDVWCSNLWSGAVTIPADAGDQRHPDLSYDRVVYEDNRSGDWDIYAYDLAQVYVTPSPPAGAEIPVATGTGDQLDPAVEGGWAVYEDFGRGNADIVACELATGEKRRIAATAAAQVDPAISGRLVVFSDKRNGNWDIYSYDLDNDTLRRLTTNKAAQTSPQIRRGTVVFQDRRNGNWDIYSVLARGGQERRLTSEGHNQTHPQFATDPAMATPLNVVFADDRGGAADIWVREARTGICRPVTSAPGAQDDPSAYCDDVFWSDERAGHPDVYWCRLQFPYLSFHTPSATVGYNATVQFSGELSVDYGSADGLIVELAGSGGRRSVSLVGDGSAEAGFKISIPSVKRKVTMRAWYPGDADHLPTWGGSVAVKPRALLGRPSLSISAGMNGGLVRSVLTISGSLRPHHTAGSKAVAVALWQKSLTGAWQLRKTVRAGVRGSGAVSAYALRLEMSPGYWKVQAVHDDADHARTLSEFSRVVH